MSNIFESGVFKKALLIALEHNKEQSLANKLRDSNIALKNFGYAHQTRGIPSPWDSEGLDLQIRTRPDKMPVLTDIDIAKIKNFSYALLPENYVIGDVDNLPLLEDDICFTLPQTTSQELTVLTNTINDAIKKNEPSLAIDRLHTFSTKYLLELCVKNGIEIQDAKGKQHPLNSLAGSLKKHYKNKVSEFSATAMSCFISLFEHFNKIRNDRSYAHNNDILSNTESVFVLQTVSAMLNFLDKIELDNKTTDTDNDLPF